MTSYYFSNNLFIADSHRARLPPITMARVVMDDQLEERSRREFRFNAMEGIIIFAE